MKTLWVMMTALFLLGGCSSMQVKTDYNPDVSMARFGTYAVLMPDADVPDTLQNERIVKAVTAHLEGKGYRVSAEQSADFLVRFHTTTLYDVPGNVSFGFGFGGFSGNFGGSVSTTQRPTNDEMMLTVEMVMPSDEKVIWRGSAKDTLQRASTPEAREEETHKLVNALLKSFPEHR